MLYRTTATLLIALPVSLVQAAVTSSKACADIHFMLARGTTESYPGTTYSMAELVAENTNLTSNYEDIIYPAVDESGSDSYFIGRTAVGSQGAMIVGDALAGGGGDSTLGNVTQPLISEEVSKHIAANVYYGNPRHAPFQSYNFGNNTWNVTGKYPRLEYQVQYLHDRYLNVTADWCNNGDGVCSPSEGADSLSLHIAYAQDYDLVAAAWILKTIGA